MPESKFTPEIAKVIIKNLRTGCKLDVAAQAVGITRQTLHNWIKKGEAEDPEFLPFLQSYQEARAEVELDLVEIVHTAARKDPEQAKWLLSHINPEAWGNKSEQKVEHSGSIQHLKFTFDTTEQPQSTTSAPAKTKGDTQTTQQP